MKMMKRRMTSTPSPQSRTEKLRMKENSTEITMSTRHPTLNSSLKKGDSIMAFKSKEGISSILILKSDLSSKSLSDDQSYRLSMNCKRKRRKNKEGTILTNTKRKEMLNLWSLKDSKQNTRGSTRKLKDENFKRTSTLRIRKKLAKNLLREEIPKKLCLGSKMIC
jgi:hypothetical protein